MRQSHCMSNHCISDLTSAHLLLPVRCHVIASGGSSYTRRLSRVHACMATAPVKCATNEGCSEVANSECIDTTCRCVSGYVIAIGGYDIAAQKWRRGCRNRKLFEDAPGCRGTADCEAAVPGSYCDTGSGRCLCRAGFVAGRSLNASCARISKPTCRTNVDCSDAIPHSHCDSLGRCQCDVRTSDDGTGNACILRPIGGFCREAADCTDAVPSSHCGADGRCQCISGFYAVDADSSSPVCVRRCVGSNCLVTSDCVDAFTGSDCVRGACACRLEYKVVEDGVSCQRRRIDNDDDAVCIKHSDDCKTMFANSVCGDDDRCACLSGYRPEVQRFACVRRRRLSDTSPCRNDPDCFDAIPNSRCDPPTRRCACPTGYLPEHTTSGRNGSDVCRRRIVGDQCLTVTDCLAILSATCDPTGFCACVTGYGIPTSGSVDCQRRRIGGEVGCERDQDCLEAIQFSICRHASCVCLAGYMAVDNATACVQRKLHLAV